jgi:N-acetylmuramoyl-L-alanine amidase
MLRTLDPWSPGSGAWSLPAPAGAPPLPGCYPHLVVWFLFLAAAIGAGPAFTVAIDAGHGGTNRGAEGLQKGFYEKKVTLEIARRIRRRLSTERGMKVVLCRDADVLVPVRARVRCANDAGARLFLSIHANASPEARRGAQRGFELYVLSPADVEQDATAAALTAATEADAAFLGHRVRATAVESLAAARRISWQLADTLGPDRDRGIKQSGASLDVLQGLKMPAVLVEVGFIDHAEEGKMLATEEGWERVAAALAKAVSDLRSRELRGRADPSITAHRTRPRADGAPAAVSNPPAAPEGRKP